MHEVLVNRLGGLSLPRKSVVRLTDRLDMTLDVYRGRKTTIQQLIRNMYNNIKSRIKTKDGTSPFFPCCNGVRQGENLSPFLFSIFLNDLEHYFSTHNISGINCEFADEDIYVFVKIFILLYADDTVIFSEDSINLQNALNALENYCHTWKLVVKVPCTMHEDFPAYERRKLYKV